MIEPRPLSGLRILVLEDEYLIAMDVEQLCRDHGAAEVVIMRSVPDAATLVCDVAILDVMLGGVSTLPFAAKLRERNIPFIFATGYDASERFADFAGVPVVGKPYGAGELVDAVARAAGRREEPDPVGGLSG